MKSAMLDVFTCDIVHGYTALQFHYTLWVALESRNLPFTNYAMLITCMS